MISSALLLATDPHGLGGALLRGPAGAARDAWIAAFRAALPAASPLRRVPLRIADDRLIGGVDIAATLSAGRRIAARGLLAEADGGALILPMAERLERDAVGRFCAVLDTGSVTVEREGVAAHAAARVGIVALDEGIEDEHAAEALADRLAFLIDLAQPGPPEPAAPDETRVADAAVLTAVTEAAVRLGIASMRAPILCLRAARAAASLAGRKHLTQGDAELAVRLVLAPRATAMPAPPPEAPEDTPPEETPPENPPPDEQPPPETDLDDSGPLAEQLIEAALAALPPNLLARLAAAGAPGRQAGRAEGKAKATSPRGRPMGVRRPTESRPPRLDVPETLRAAAPMQALRRAGAPMTGGPAILVRREDFRIRHRHLPPRRTLIFTVDASGSAALGRLAEAKGAVELLLAESYVRRDQVALIALRGREAALLLEPTSALARARRCLASLPGGGGTPLASGIDAALLLATRLRRDGGSPFLVLLTDGRANVARDGKGGGPGGREAAQADAVSAAAAWKRGGLPAVLIDISISPADPARRVAAAMGAEYLALPGGDARAVASAVRARRATLT